MGFHLYCFTPPGFGPGPDLAGVRRELISCVPVAGLSLWVHASGRAPEVGPEAIRSHHEVVSQAWRSAPACLPVRFGQWFPDRSTLEGKVEGRREELEDALARVAGAGEHGVRVVERRATEEGSRVGRASSGRAYLEALRERVRREEARARRAHALGAEVEEALGDVLRARRIDLLPAGQGLASLSHLVPAGRETEYRRRLSALGEGHGELRFLTGGPWPPYSFAP